MNLTGYLKLALKSQGFSSISYVYIVEALPWLINGMVPLKLCITEYTRRTSINVYIGISIILYQNNAECEAEACFGHSCTYMVISHNVRRLAIPTSCPRAGMAGFLPMFNQGFL